MQATKNPSGMWGLMYSLHSQGSTPWSAIKHGTFHFHFCCGNMQRTLALCQALRVSLEQTVCHKAPNYKLGM